MNPNQKWSAKKTSQPGQSLLIMEDGGKWPRVNLQMETEIANDIAASMAAGWKTAEPPKDGTAIIAKGRIIAEDEFSSSSAPYLGEIRWLKTESGFEGWVYGGSQPLSVTCSPDETFVIDWWIEPPPADADADLRAWENHDQPKA